MSFSVYFGVICPVVTAHTSLSLSLSLSLSGDGYHQFRRKGYVKVSESETILPLSRSDPFSSDISATSSSAKDNEGFVHIRIQQRNGRKTLTTVQGISQQYDLKKIARVCKKVCVSRVSIEI